MRVTRTFMLWAVAIAVAGCAQRPVAYMPLAGALGIDGTVYGSATYGQAAPAAYPLTTGSVAAPTYAAAAPAYPRAPSYAPPAYAPPAPGYAVPTPGYAAPGYAAPGYAAPGYAAPGYPSAPGRVVAVPAAYVPLAQDGPYTLDSADHLRVVVFGQDGLTNSYVVDASGCIAMPLIGTVPARGMTTEQLSGRIADQLRQGFIREPHVAVEIEADRPFFILGEVTQPGQYPYVANMTVETAVAIAGGFGPRASKSTVQITRNIPGQQMRGDVPMNFPVRPGDTIVVKERWF